MKSLKNKKILITGGANGIGYLIAKMTAQEGAHVIIFDIDQKKTRSSFKRINFPGEFNIYL